jgi:HK97 family phage prohead protease
MSADRTKFFVDVPATKAAEAPSGDLKLLGYASTWTLDRDNEYVEKSAFDGSLEKYLGQNPILLWQHDLERPIGRVEAALVDEHGLHVRAHVPKPEPGEPDWAHLAYNKIKSGIIKTFSIGGFFERGVKGGKRVINGVDLFEISVVSVPSNPDSIFAAAVKSLEGRHRPELTPQHIAQMKQVLGMEPVADPELAAMLDEERKERYEELAEIYRKTGKLPPSFDAYREVVREYEARDTETIDQEATLERAGKIAVLIQRVQGYAPSVKEIAAEVAEDEKEKLARLEEKAGRVLSKANEAKLRQALDSIQGILQAVDEMDEEPETPEPPATTIARNLEG